MPKKSGYSKNYKKQIDNWKGTVSPWKNALQISQMPSATMVKLLEIKYLPPAFTEYGPQRAILDYLLVCKCQKYIAV